jgi:hypothetical protein
VNFLNPAESTATRESHPDFPGCFSPEQTAVILRNQRGGTVVLKKIKPPGNLKRGLIIIYFSFVIQMA